MELGALVCTPKQPTCPECPVRAHCRAHRLGKVTQFPNLAKRAAATQRRFIAFVIRSRGRFLVRQRQAGQVNAHLWEFPNFEIPLGSKSSDSLAKLARQHFGVRMTNLQSLCSIKHTITRYRITLDVLSAQCGVRNAELLKENERWLGLEEMHRVPFTSAHKKILQRLDQNELGNHEIRKRNREHSSIPDFLSS